MLGDFNGESDSMSSMIESMMSQILSKEVLYEPMKELTELVNFFLFFSFPFCLLYF